MTAKKLLGYFFMVLSVLFALAIILQLQKLFKALADLVRVVTGTLGEYESAKAITVFLFWVIHFFVVIILCSYGRKWTRATVCRFAMGGLFTTNVYTEYKIFGYHKCVCGERNPAYCKCAVSGSGFYCQCLMISL